jgi:hypothetical protein
VKTVGISPKAAAAALVAAVPGLVVLIVGIVFGLPDVTAIGAGLVGGGGLAGGGAVVASPGTVVPDYNTPVDPDVPAAHDDLASA